jgi:serine/threonine protein kinase
MVKGLVPPNLQNLSWDLIDLILKLTDKDSEKRPKMILVLRHRYFVLTNDRNKRHFSDQLWAAFTFLPEKDEIKRKNEIFSNRNFQEWYETLFKDKPKSTKEIENMTNTFNLFTSVSIY